MIKKINNYIENHSKLLDKIFFSIAITQMLFAATVAILLDHRWLVSPDSTELQIATAKIYAMLLIGFWMNMITLYLVNTKISKVK